MKIKYLLCEFSLFVLADKDERFEEEDGRIKFQRCSLHELSLLADVAVVG